MKDRPEIVPIASGPCAAPQPEIKSIFGRQVEADFKRGIGVILFPITNAATAGQLALHLLFLDRSSGKEFAIIHYGEGR